MSLINKIFNEDKRRLKKLTRRVQSVLDLEEKYRNMSDDELRGKTAEFKKRLAAGETLDDIYPEAFATAREAAYRVIGEFPFPVQLIGATVLHEGDLAEMATGSGKTLTSVMAVYLNALEGKGVHIVTVNEYLAERDSEWMGQIHRWLGLTVGLNLHSMSKEQKRAAYECDITYTTNAELGFDYLRDNMVASISDRVLRGMHYAVVDEADSVLIDDARTPLIISGMSRKNSEIYNIADWMAKNLTPDQYEVDIKTKTVQLTESGIDRIEKINQIPNLYDPNYSDLLHCINNALKANYTMSADVDYVVDRDRQEILIVDPNTGRTMEGRQWSNGLHQAVEAKEHVKIKKETETRATITYQNFFRLYDKLCGMTGTAKTEEEEFLEIYNMYVVPVPTNEPVIRVDYPDYIYGTKKNKYNALLDEVAKRHATGQPVLIGTISIETSELISKYLQSRHIEHEVLNAKNHAREAEIIAKAGQKGAVTIATNMAGRGTDIKLGEGVRELGGLCVLGTERHESRRIDNQLRGRAGRQGDPGMSRFYISTEDDLLRRFSSDRVKLLYEAIGDGFIESKSITKSITTAQKRVESMNYDSRKTLLQYDDVMRQQRETVYKQRDFILANDDVHSLIHEKFIQLINDTVSNAADPDTGEFDAERLEKALTDLGIDTEPLRELYENRKIADITKFTDELTERIWEHYDSALQPLTDEIKKAERDIALAILDGAWSIHIDTMDRLRNGIGLRGYAQKNPVQAYINEGYELFSTMMSRVAEDIAKYFIQAVNRGQEQQNAAHA